LSFYLGKLTTVVRKTGWGDGKLLDRTLASSQVAPTMSTGDSRAVVRTVVGAAKQGREHGKVLIVWVW